VHGERSVCVCAASGTNLLESSKLPRRLRRRLLLVLRIGLLLLAFFQLGLHLGKGSAVEGTSCDTAMLECAAVEARAVVIVALTDDLTTAHDDTAMAVVQRRLGGLLEAKGELVVRLHLLLVLGGWVDLLVKEVWAYGYVDWLIGE
jgi:hypothetical protein